MGPLDNDEAVWYDSIDIRDSVGVGPCAPVARGRALRSSEAFRFGAGRMVRMEESDGAVGLGD